MQDMAAQGIEPTTEKLKQYDFVTAGDQITTTLMEAAENLVTEAQNLQERTKVLTEGIQSQLKEHVELMADMNRRIHAFGDSMVAAHAKFLDGK
jgi:hypothetical protein